MEERLDKYERTTKLFSYIYIKFGHVLIPSGTFATVRFKMSLLARHD